MTHTPESSNNNQSTDYEILGSEFSDSYNEDDTEQSRYFTNITALIENDLAGIKAVHEDLNKMREKVACLEWVLLSKVSSSTWKDISELIGLSCATVIHECFKILDHADEAKSS